MSVPIAPIDADLGEWDKISYFVLEISAIWRTQNLADAGSATWTKIFDLTTDFILDGLEPGFTRIRCAPGTPYKIVYVLGYATKNDTGDTQPFIMRSTDNGLTWSQTWINEALDTRPYYITYRTGFSLPDASLSMYHIRKGDADAAVNPLCITIGLRYTGAHATQWAWGVGANTIDSSSYISGIYPQPDIFASVYNVLLGDAGASATSVLNDYWGVGNWGWLAGPNHTMPKEANRIQVALGSNGAMYQGETWVFWNYPSVALPRGFDVARTNHDVLFLGLSRKIITSTDGGYTWTDCTNDFGAYDICIDPQLAGVFYCWSTEGELRCVIANIPQLPALITGDTQGEFTFLRIARDFNTGTLWVIDSLGNLKEYKLGGWSTLLSGLELGCGLKAFYASPTKLACLDNNNIHLSLDAGATWSLKKGGWSTYAKPNTIHLLGTAP